jgi:serine protease AprX
VVENPTTHIYYASSRAQGVFESVPDLNSVRTGITASANSTITNYPNPFTGTTTIAFKNDADALTQVAIYDVLGRSVRTVANKFFTAGDHSLPFDASGLAPGNYMIVVRSNGTVRSAWMTVE